MRYTLTDASQRAMRTAARWAFADTTCDCLGPGLLLGLLAEDECRAADMLARASIGPEAVHQRWPGLQQVDNPDSTVVAECAAIELLGRLTERLDGDPRGWPLATEHLLLGLLLADDETARWLAGQGLSLAEVEAEIGRIHQSMPEAAEPIDFPAGDELPPWPVASLPPLQAAAGADLVFRIVDAAANRAREALRVVEDFARFGLNDAAVTRELKHLRHDLAAAIGQLPAAALLASRDTPGDVGTEISTAAERRRAGIESVLTANFKRLQEALRSLEEYGKLVSEPAGAAFEALRYRSYSLEQRVGLQSPRRQLLAQARLYVLADGRSTVDEFGELLRILVTSGVDVIQLRDKSLSDAALLKRGRLAREITRGSRTLFIMNDRADLAVACDADGVHVGQDELPVQEARSVVGPGRLIGLSTHNLEQALAAVGTGADYIGVGPVFPSRTKDFADFPGLRLLRQVSGCMQMAAFAIGGIGLDNIHRVLETGFQRVAVSGAVCGASDPAAAARELRAALDP